MQYIVNKKWQLFARRRFFGLQILYLLQLVAYMIGYVWLHPPGYNNRYHPQFYADFHPDGMLPSVRTLSSERCAPLIGGSKVSAPISPSPLRAALRPMRCG